MIDPLTAPTAPVADVGDLLDTVNHIRQGLLHVEDARDDEDCYHQASELRAAISGLDHDLRCLTREGVTLPVEVTTSAQELRECCWAVEAALEADGYQAPPLDEFRTRLTTFENLVWRFKKAN